MAGQQKQDGGVRERLLMAALHLFNNKGYAATSVREIVAASGVSKPVLYYYFGNKEGIYLELMNSSFAQFDASLARMTSISGTTGERVIHFCRMILDLVVDKLEVLRLVYAIYYGPPQGAPPINFEDYFTTMVMTVQKLVEEGMAQGELRSVDSRDVAWAVVSILNTTMEEHLCQIPPRVNHQQMERMVRLVIQGLTVK